MARRLHQPTRLLKLHHRHRSLQRNLPQPPHNQVTPLAHNEGTEMEEDLDFAEVVAMAHDEAGKYRRVTKTSKHKSSSLGGCECGGLGLV